MSTDRGSFLRDVRRVVVKLGSAVLAGPDGRLDEPLIAALTAQIAALRARGVDVIVVSSGAISAGMAEMGLRQRPPGVSEKQALAAIGQGDLMRLYHEAFAAHGLHVAQILLSRGDLDDRQRYLNARNAILHLLQMGVVPVVNENDTTAIEELGFSDNDILSAAVAAKVDAHLLLLLTVVDGLHGADGAVTSHIERVDEETMRLVRSERTPLGRGGMESKLLAAKNAMTGGVAAVIAGGREERVIERILAGEAIGTWFAPAPRRLAGRKRWIAFGKAGEGAHLRVDAGAARALTAGGKSLLPIGVTAVIGQFERGDVVEIRGPADELIGRGLVNYASEQVERIRGARSEEIASRLGDAPEPEVIHRDNLIIYH